MEQVQGAKLRVRLHAHRADHAVAYADDLRILAVNEMLTTVPQVPLDLARALMVIPHHDFLGVPGMVLILM